MAPLCALEDKGNSAVGSEQSISLVITVSVMAY